MILVVFISRSCFHSTENIHYIQSESDKNQNEQNFNAFVECGENAANGKSSAHITEIIFFVSDGNSFE